MPDDVSVEYNPGPDEPTSDIEAVKLRHEDELLRRPEVTGVFMDEPDRACQELGRVLEQLRAMDAFDNTLIFFLSDNGASAEIMVRTDGHDPAAAPGSAASYLCLGPGWSTT